jgi:hypothetical protein
MNSKLTYGKEQIKWRRAAHGTVNNDLVYLRKQAQENLKLYILEKLPGDYQKCMVGINQVLKIS